MTQTLNRKFEDQRSKIEAPFALRSSPFDLQGVVSEINDLAVRALARMYLPEPGLFAFRVRKTNPGESPRASVNRIADDLALEGVSRRYTAIVLIGLADQDEDVAHRIFGNETAYDVCGRLLDEVEHWNNLGDAALTLWAAYRLEHSGADRALKRLRQLDPCRGRHPTVEIAWSLTALSQDPGQMEDTGQLAGQVARRLLDNFNRRSGLFPHWPEQTCKSWLRSHVLCYADLVYPIQALSYFHRRTRDTEAREVARHCAERMCALQGRDGQWWWHYDFRSGDVLERYPVYAVHQNSMGPMALFALQDACGFSAAEPVVRGLRWLMHAPEIQGSLIDRKADFIWRKVARHEPGKLVRGLQALASRVHPGLRLPATDTVFPPGWVDYESRPYHMGWILHAWANDRVSQSARRGLQSGRIHPTDQSAASMPPL